MERMAYKIIFRACNSVKVKVTQSCPTLCNPMDQSMEFSRSDYWSEQPFPSPGIFQTQELNPGLPHYRRILYQLSHQGSQLLFNLSVMSDSFVILWTVAHQMPRSMGFPGKNTGVGCHFLLQNELLLLLLLDQANKLSQIHSKGVV